MSNDHSSTPAALTAGQSPDHGQPVVIGSGAGFGWFHRRDLRGPDHVIGLCAGHRYLVTKGGWKPGPGDMPDLPPADGCCVCMGTATIKRMQGAPLSLPNVAGEPQPPKN